MTKGIKFPGMRSVVRLGESLYINLPIEYCEENGIGQAHHLKVSHQGSRLVVEVPERQP